MMNWFKTCAADRSKTPIIYQTICLGGIWGNASKGRPMFNQWIPTTTRRLLWSVTVQVWSGCVCTMLHQPLEAPRGAEAHCIPRRPQCWVPIFRKKNGVAWCCYILASSCTITPFCWKMLKVKMQFVSRMSDDVGCLCVSEVNKASIILLANDSPVQSEVWGIGGVLAGFDCVSCLIGQKEA